MKFEDIKKIDDSMRNKAITKEKRNIEKLTKTGQANSTLVGRRLIFETVDLCMNHVNDWLDSVLTSKIAQNKRYAWKLYDHTEEEKKLKIDIEALTLMANQKIISSMLSSKETTIEHICKEIGTDIDRELLYRHFKKHHNNYLMKLEKGVLSGEKSSLRFINQNIANINKQLEINKYDGLTAEERVKIGFVFYSIFKRETNHILTDTEEPLIKVVNTAQNKRIITPSNTLLEWYKINVNEVLKDEVHYEPVEYIPEDFTTIYSGGYKTIHNPFCKNESSRFFKEAADKDFTRLFNVVNMMQKTAYEIHQKTFEVVDYYYTNEIDIKTEKGGFIIPSRAKSTYEEETDEIKRCKEIEKERKELYKKYSPKSKIITAFNKQYKNEIDELRRHKMAIKRDIVVENTNKGKLSQYSFSIERCAKKMLGKKFYLPIQLDSRGRQYYRPFLNPQSTDFVKGLFNFAEKEDISTDLETDELQQFFIQGANEFGEDKIIDSKKVNWVLENMQDILDCAKNPYDNSAMWRRADKPVMFLQFCFEFQKYLTAVGNNEKSFNTGIIRWSDGKCNGIQHLSAISRDEKAGKLVALIDEDEELIDIYQTVAKGAYETLKNCTKRNVVKFQKEARIKGKKELVDWLRTEDGFEFKAKFLNVAKKWKKMDSIPRDIAKQPTMTIAYNAKDEGRKSQVLSALFDIDQKGGELPFDYTDYDAAAEFMGHLLCYTCTHTMPNVIALMKKIEMLSSIYTKYIINEPIVIDMPYFNFPFIQDYKTEKRRHIQISHKKESYFLYYKDELATTSAAKMRNALPPNTTHDGDACHEFLTAEDLMVNHNVKNFAGVHDSYGVSPKHAKQLNDSVREMFIKLHTENNMFQHYVDCMKKTADAYLEKNIVSFDNELKTLSHLLEIEEISQDEYKESKDKIEASKTSIINDLVMFHEEIDNVKIKTGDLDLESVLTSHRFFS